MVSIITSKNQDRVALLLSVALHLLLVICFYYYLIHTPQTAHTPNYHITVAPHNVQEPGPASPGDHHPTPSNTTTTSNLHTKHTVLENSQQLSLDKQDEPVDTSHQETETAAIDTRALYPAHQQPTVGVSLELPGWIWDTIPSLRDQTDEIGKLVFEITIDDMGEIIAIRTLEKTVSPVVEQFYKDEIAKLTFTKTSQQATYQPNTTGKITFTLKYKNNTSPSDDK